MDKNRKALETIALGFSQGIVSSDILIKACDNYKLQAKLLDDEKYDILVSKSLLDQLNGVKVSKTIQKAIVPGQTKYFDGVLYIYSATKNGSKTEYGWHVARKSNVGKSSKMDDKAAKAAADAVNDLFPTDLSSLTTVKALGGSTGAQLVKDIKGNEYVMKKVDKVKNPSGNADHVRSEYMANMLYNILGQRTPDYELYNADSDDVTLLSRFIPGTRQPNASDFAKMGEGFIADVLLANWDVYQNDNCLIDAGGNVIRVDNGGSLAFRAQGKLKQPPFDGDVLRTYKDMLKHNSLLAKCLIQENLIQQIDAALSKKDDIVNFLKESGDDNLAKIFEQRLEGLKGIKDYINAEIKRKETLAAAKAGKIPPRKLLKEDEMYRELDPDEIDEIFQDVVKMAGSERSALTDSSSPTGWSILSKICQARGFDARPRVVTESEFWKEAAKSDLPIMFRGHHGRSGKTGADYSDMFRFDDQCFYGTQGIWGQGIYAHTDDTNKVYNHGGKYNKKDDVNNHSTQANYKSSRAYYDADSYAGSETGGVVKIAWEKGANVVNLDDLLKEIQSTPPQTKNKGAVAVIKKLQAELATAKKDWMDSELALQNISTTIRDQVYAKMHYDESAIEEMYNEVDNTNWGNRTANNLPDYPSYDTFVLGKMREWVEKNGGSVEIGEDKEYALFSIGGQSISITRHGWENNAIKRKNSLTQPYNYHATRFKTFMETNCVGRVQKAVDHAIKNSTDATKKLQTEVEVKKKMYYDIQDQIQRESQANFANDLYSYIYDRVKGLDPRSDGDSMSVVGIFAAMEGYDGIFVHNGNGGIHGFNVILNRSKVITSIE